MNGERKLLIDAYREFNARNIEAVLARMHPDVEWANGMEAGHVHGREGVRAYWTRQWKMLDPHVEPLKFETDQTGRILIDVHQVVHDLQGNLILDTIVHHAYRIRENLIERMDIE
jgi:nuclear transport factor 2 (NTF2) superfamily protein